MKVTSKKIPIPARLLINKYKKHSLIYSAVALLLIVAVIFGLQVYNRGPRINDACFNWRLPKEITIQRYDPCSSLSLIKVSEGREVKANFVITRPLIKGKDVFMGTQEEVFVEGKPVFRYLGDTRDSEAGMGTSHIDYSISYDRFPVKTAKEGGRTVMTAEFILATKDNTHVSDKEIKDFIRLTDKIMANLQTR